MILASSNQNLQKTSEGEFCSRSQAQNITCEPTKKQVKEFGRHSQAQDITPKLVKKQRNGNLVKKESDVYCIGSLLPLHIFKDCFEGIGIFDSYFFSHKYFYFQLANS